MEAERSSMSTCSPRSLRASNRANNGANYTDRVQGAVNESVPAPRRDRKRRNPTSTGQKTDEAPQKQRKTSVRKTATSKISHHYRTRKATQLASSKPVASEQHEYEELPHNLGRVRVTRKTFQEVTDEIVDTKSEERSLPDQTGFNDKTDAAVTTQAAKGKKGKGILGVSPFPLYARPTPEECKEVYRLLTAAHGEFEQPAAIPKPSLTVTGCGEVPSVVDAVVRTIISANTSRNNSSLAFRSLVKTFGVLHDGIGKGSCDYNKVRLAHQEEVFDAIKGGGLGRVKSGYIKKFLDMVYEENQERRRRILASSKTGDPSTAIPADQNLEVLRAEQDVLTLDHLHLVSDQDAFDALQKYPGIGPKTASCVLLFCLRRPSFAVDTHVYRLSQWLGWVPPPGPKADYVPGAKGDLGKVGEEAAFFHLDARAPNELKYSLHQLLIRHGMDCNRCQAKTDEGSQGWNKICVLEHLLKRTGRNKEVKVKKEVDLDGQVIKRSQLAFTKKVVVKAEVREEEDDDEYIP